MIDAARLRELLSYEPETGAFVWLVRPSNRTSVGCEAGCIGQRDGYRVIGIEGTLYKASRLAWLYMTGEWPSHYVDHINGRTFDDRWANLRSASHAENLRNRGAQKNNTSGFKGVSQYASGKWCARVTRMGQTFRKNGFNTAEAAAAAYARMAKQVHGEFART